MHARHLWPGHNTSRAAAGAGLWGPDELNAQIRAIPHLLSLLATDTWNGGVEGLNEINAQYQQTYGPGDYVPNVFIQYWSMRVMAYLGSLVLLLGLWGG